MGLDAHMDVHARQHLTSSHSMWHTGVAALLSLSSLAGFVVFVTQVGNAHNDDTASQYLYDTWFILADGRSGSKRVQPVGTNEAALNVAITVLIAGALFALTHMLQLIPSCGTGQQVSDDRFPEGFDPASAGLVVATPKPTSAAANAHANTFLPAGDTLPHNATAYARWIASNIHPVRWLADSLALALVWVCVVRVAGVVSAMEIVLGGALVVAWCWWGIAQEMLLRPRTRPDTQRALSYGTPDALTHAAMAGSFLLFGFFLSSPLQVLFRDATHTPGWAVSLFVITAVLYGVRTFLPYAQVLSGPHNYTAVHHAYTLIGVVAVLTAQWVILLAHL